MGGLRGREEEREKKIESIISITPSPSHLSKGGIYTEPKTLKIKFAKFRYRGLISVVMHLYNS